MQHRLSKLQRAVLVSIPLQMSGVHVALHRYGSCDKHVQTVCIVAHLAFYVMHIRMHLNIYRGCAKLAYLTVP